MKVKVEIDTGKEIISLDNLSNIAEGASARLMEQASRHERERMILGEKLGGGEGRSWGACL